MLQSGGFLIGQPAQTIHEGWWPIWHLPKFQITSPSLQKQEVESRFAILFM